MVTEILINIGSGNGLLPDGTKPLPEPMLTDHQWTPVTFHIRAISQQMLQPSITKICLKIACLKFRLNFPGANELSNWDYGSAGLTLLIEEFRILIIFFFFFLSNQITFFYNGVNNDDFFKHDIEQMKFGITWKKNIKSTLAVYQN